MTAAAWLGGVFLAFLPMLAVGIWRLALHLRRIRKRKAVLSVSRGLVDVGSWEEAVLIRRLEGRLWHSQERRGPHAGEFGKGLRVEEETHYRAAEEALDIKPRLYLTFWALREASRCGKSRAIRRTARSFAVRFPEGVVSIVRPAQRGVSPVGAGRTCSVRHSIKLAHCWLLLPGSFPGKGPLSEFGAGG